MSESKVRLGRTVNDLKEELRVSRLQLTRLLTYVLNAQEDHPDVAWEPLPDTYPEALWRAAA